MICQTSKSGSIWTYALHIFFIGSVISDPPNVDYLIQVSVSRVLLDILKAKHLRSTPFMSNYQIFRHLDGYVRTGAVVSW